MRIRKQFSGLAAACVITMAPALASAAVVKPAELSDLLLWYRADDLTATTAAGGSVTSVTDASGNSNDAGTISGYSAATFDITDVPTISFDATLKDALGAIDTLGGSGVNDVTIITVYKSSNVSDSESRPMGFGGTGIDGGSVQKNINLANDPSLRFDGAAIASYGTSITADEYFTRSVTRSGNTFTDYFNGTQVKSANQSLSGPIVDEFYLGDLHADGNPGGGGASDHQVAEVIVYNRALSTTERQSVENYLTAKYYSNAYYRFEEGADGAILSDFGGALDHTVNLNNGTGVNSVSFSADTANNAVPLTGSANNLSADFERGSNQRIVVADDSSISFGDSSFTIESYVKFETLADGTGSRQYLVWKKGASAAADSQLDYGIVFAEQGGYSATSNGELVFVQGNGSSTHSVASGLVINDATDWHYIAVSFDAVNDIVRFILDDQVVELSNTFTAAANGLDLVLGGHISGTGVWTRYDGLMDELRITGSYLELNSLLNIPTPAALPAGIGLMGLLATRRRRG
ncbi:LamG domain-containing protein [Planctomycetales bacterium ZRK34]|nr:LamG domain-containing protein [Planctomycetales bacterium ZRK34]